MKKQKWIASNFKTNLITCFSFLEKSLSIFFQQCTQSKTHEKVEDIWHTIGSKEIYKLRSETIECVFAYPSSDNLLSNFIKSFMITNKRVKCECI